MIQIKLALKNGATELMSSNEKSIVNLAYGTQYALGDYYELMSNYYPVFVWVQLDASLNPTLIYLTNKWTYSIPFNIRKEWPFPTGAFIGRRHYAWARVAEVAEINTRRNLALNCHDQHDFYNAFPHATANYETDNNLVFYACNAIDGVSANECHGSYPYESWGTGGRKDAEFQLDFGYAVDLTTIKLVLRADFPHDTNWDKAKITFSNGKSKEISLIHTENEQTVNIHEKGVTSLKLSDLRCNSKKKGFTALTQIEAWGIPSKKVL